MQLVNSFLELVKPLHVVMTQPSFFSFLTMLSGWVLKLNLWEVNDDKDSHSEDRIGV